MNMQILALAVLSFSGILTMSKGCSPPKGIYKAPTLDLKMMKSQIVVHGVALSREQVRRFHGSDEVYSVKFEVRCIYKGAPLEEIIRIDEVGAIPGHCHATNLTTGQHYLVYLERRDNDRFTQMFVQDPGNEDYIDEIIGLCETSVNYPTGYSLVNNKEDCPLKDDTDDCLPEPVPTTTFHHPEEQDTKTSPLPSDPVQPKPSETDENGHAIPYKPVVAEEKNEDNGNGSTALTLSMSALTCLVLCAVLLL